ncbi:MAG TPA: tetratricopeptide repeat protein, partial [Cryptosporangiaceae bacterium]|nr:tetratricopeptide repeat protein [Cryptosporangiaceae bacterium]
PPSAARPAPAGPPGHTAPAGPPAGAPAGAVEQEERRWLVRAVEQLDKGQPEVAAFTARRAVDEDPENSYAWAVLAEAAARSADPKAAQEAISRALVLDPESAALHVQRGWILEHAGEHERGVGAYRSAAKLAPNRPDYRVRAVKALLRADLVDEAVTEAEAAYQAFPEDGDIRSALGAALAERAVAAQHELPDGRLVISSLSHASYVLALANRGLSVHPPDPGVRVDLERQRAYARKASRRRFSMAAFRRNYRWPVGLGLLAVAGVCCGPGFAQGFSEGFRLMYYFGLTVVVMALAGAVLLTCFEPTYKRNATLIENTMPRRTARGPGKAVKKPR